MENRQIKERPILFSGEMVRAILDGRKTQTRRVIKKTIDFTSQNMLPKNWMWAKHMLPDEDGEFIGVPNCSYEKDMMIWVRETYHQHYSGGVLGGRPCYEADNNCIHPQMYKKIPSIFMPRWASRILLEVVSVRVERVQDISLADINAEGTPDTLDPTKRPYGTRREQFQRLWDSINEKRGYSWESNPWVWVIEFKVI